MPDNPHPEWGYWAARSAAQVIANVAIAQQAQAQYGAIAAAQAAAAATSAQTRSSLVAAAKAHIDAAVINPAVSANADAISHLAAAEQILATIT